MGNSIKRGSLKFPEPYWSKISKDAKDLLTKLLQKNPNQRLEAADILDHPWIIKMTTEEINGNNDIQTPSSNPICSRVVQNVPMSPTMSQNRPVVRAAAKMRRQSSVVEFCLQHEDY